MANTQTSNVKTKNKNCQTERDRQTSTNALQEIEAALEDYTRVLEAPPLSQSRQQHQQNNHQLNKQQNQEQLNKTKT